MFTDLPGELGFLFGGYRPQTWAHYHDMQSLTLFSEDQESPGTSKSQWHEHSLCGATNHSHSHFINKYLLDSYSASGFVSGDEESAVNKGILHSRGGGRQENKRLRKTERKERE